MNCRFKRRRNQCARNQRPFVRLWQPVRAHLCNRPAANWRSSPPAGTPTPRPVRFLRDRDSLCRAELRRRLHYRQSRLRFRFPRGAPRHRRFPKQRRARGPIRISWLCISRFSNAESTRSRFADTRSRSSIHALACARPSNLAGSPPPGCRSAASGMVARCNRPAPRPVQAQPAPPRPGMPTRSSTPVPGPADLPRPIRPGQPVMRGPGIPGTGWRFCSGNFRRQRTLHPTSPCAAPSSRPLRFHHGTASAAIKPSAFARSSSESGAGRGSSADAVVAARNSPLRRRHRS